MVVKSIERLLNALNLLFESLPAVGLAESEGRLLIEGSPLDERMTGSTNMIKDLFLTHKIHSLSFLKGVTQNEIQSLFELLKPKALPTGLSLVQALVQKPIPHITLNEKVYVAIKEGEKVVTGDALPGGEENLDEALEALQYFLQIFSRVRPDSNKREVAKKMIDHMGGWLTTGNVESGTAAGPKDAGALLPWQDVMNGFFSLKKTLTSANQPDQLKKVQVGMDEVLKKLVLLGESQGIPLKVPEAGEKVQDAAQGSLFDSDPVLTDLRAAKEKVLLDPGLETHVAERLPTLQQQDDQEPFEAVWGILWKKIAAGNEEEQAIALRHLNRLQWNAVPRHLQLDGLKALREFLLDPRFPPSYYVGLTLAQNWLPLEMGSPNWEELVSTTGVLKNLAEKAPPMFEKQDLAAKVALETIYSDPVLEHLVNLHSKDSGSREAVEGLFVLLKGLTGPFLMEKALKPGDKEWEKAVALLKILENKGLNLIEPALQNETGPERMGLFLELFQKIPLPGRAADHIERNWESYKNETQVKILETIALWKRTEFRILLLRLLDSIENPLALPAMKVLALTGLEGDSRKIIAAVRKFPEQSKQKEKFWVSACLALGEMADPLSIDALMEWAEKYRFLEKKKVRDMKVREAALEALGHFRSNSVKTFLETLLKDAEKEIKPAAERALKAVEAKLEKPPEKSEGH